MNADGSGLTILTNDLETDHWPEWSPDGNKIAFATWRDGNAEVYVMNSDSSNQVNLTNNAAIDGTPSWSPDGATIAFRRGNDIFLMNSDGSNPTRVAAGPGRNWQPACKP